MSFRRTTKAYWLYLILLTPAFGAEVLYQDENILVTKDGVFSQRTKQPIKFRSAPDWVEEDFFTQQSKYCEKGGKSDDGAENEVGM